MVEESRLPISPGDESVFGEAIKRAQRQQAARTVHQWLSSFPQTGDVTSRLKISIGEIATTVLQHLEEGQIFFVVKSAGETDVPIKARRVRINLPPLTSLLTGRSYANKAHLIALQVRSGVTTAELGSDLGLEQLRRLYNFDMEVESRFDLRMLVSDPVILNDKDFGRFPEAE